MEFLRRQGVPLSLPSTLWTGLDTEGFTSVACGCCLSHQPILLCLRTLILMPEDGALHPGREPRWVWSNRDLSQILHFTALLMGFSGARQHFWFFLLRHRVRLQVCPLELGHRCVTASASDVPAEGMGTSAGWELLWLEGHSCLLPFCYGSCCVARSAS